MSSSTDAPKRVVITCGPSFTPVDEVRRLTNFSTGELGVLLALACVDAGLNVSCLRGVAATYSRPIDGAMVLPFTTNADLAEQLRSLPDRESVHTVFHAAALSDFEVKQVTAGDGTPLRRAKIPSDTAEIVVTLQPALKLIGQLRALFPASHIIGWKYELNGTRDDTLRAAARQIVSNRTDACVVNGRAYGEGFGVYDASRQLAHCADKPELCAWLVRSVLDR